MANKDEDKIAEEASRLAKLQIKAKQDEKNAETADKVNKKLVKALEQAQSETNVVQVTVAVASAGVGTMVGYALNKRLRKYTMEKKMVNEKGERTMGAVILADGVPVLLGVGIMVGGGFIEDGVVGAGCMGFGGGLAVGSTVHALNHDPLTNQVKAA